MQNHKILSRVRVGSLQPIAAALSQMPKLQGTELKRGWLALVLSGFSSLLLGLPGWGAEQVSVSYGPLELAVSVEALEAYAQTGELQGNLALYARFVGAEPLAQLRQMLQNRVDMTPVAISQILYSSIGETSLQYLGEFIQTEGRQNGFFALRSALILAAAEPEGLTLLNVIKRFPTTTVRIQSDRAAQVAGEFTQLLNQTDRVTTLMQEQADTEAEADRTIDFDRSPDLQQLGPVTWQHETLAFEDHRRNRSIAVDLYLPELPQPAPVVIISHGIAADREDFAELAQHMTSYGFAVAVLDHPGSDRQHFQNLLRGMTQEMTEPNEFVNRPLDVSYLLNQLAQLNRTETNLRDRLNLQQVGVIGHSLGGYTALALAGAEINFDLLKRKCDSERQDLNTANLSMPLQCEALQTTMGTASLRDERIRAIVAVNPVSNSVFGQEGLQQVQVPVMLIGGSNDVISPVLLEQVCPFSWLTMHDKYLAVIEQGTHVYSEQATSSNQIFGGGTSHPAPVLAQRYLHALSLAFAQVHVADQPQYRDYLRASYAQSISQSPHKLTLLNTFTATHLAQMLEGSCPGRYLAQDLTE